MSTTLQADEFSDVFHVLAEDELAIFCQHRHTLRSYAEQLISPRGIVQNVDSGKFDTFFRKKLFRSKATASTGLGEQDELVFSDFHGHVPLLLAGHCAERITVRDRVNRNHFYVLVGVARANA